MPIISGFLFAAIARTRFSTRRLAMLDCRASLSRRNLSLQVATSAFVRIVDTPLAIGAPISCIANEPTKAITYLVLLLRLNFTVFHL